MQSVLLLYTIRKFINDIWFVSGKSPSNPNSAIKSVTVPVDMGLTAVFREGAVFDKIAKGICVDDVTHKSIVKVDEKGTEATVIFIMMKETAMLKRR